MRVICLTATIGDPNPYAVGARLRRDHRIGDFSPTKTRLAASAPFGAAF